MFSVKFKLGIESCLQWIRPTVWKWGMALEWTGHVTVMEEATSVGKIMVVKPLAELSHG
jgi:hypothetical protein